MEGNATRQNNEQLLLLRVPIGLLTSRAAHTLSGVSLTYRCALHTCTPVVKTSVMGRIAGVIDDDEMRGVATNPNTLVVSERPQCV